MCVRMRTRQSPFGLPPRPPCRWWSQVAVHAVICGDGDDRAEDQDGGEEHDGAHAAAGPSSAHHWRTVSPVTVMPCARRANAISFQDHPALRCAVSHWSRSGMTCSASARFVGGTSSPLHKVANFGKRKFRGRTRRSPGRGGRGFVRFGSVGLRRTTSRAAHPCRPAGRRHHVRSRHCVHVGVER